MIFAVSMLFVDQTIVAIATGVMGVCSWWQCDASSGASPRTVSRLVAEAPEMPADAPAGG